MRNTTMKDKLAEVLLGEMPRPQNPPLLVPLRPKNVIVAAALKNAQKSKRTNGFAGAAARVREKDRSPAQADAPRYVVPPKRRNPFSHHAYPFYEAPSQPEPEAEPEALETGQPEVNEIHEVPPVAVQEEQQDKADEVEAVLDSQFVVHREEPVTTNDELSAVNCLEPPPSLAEVPHEVPNVVPAMAEAGTPVLHPPNEDLFAGTPVPYTPPNLAWLEEHTPFADHLRGIVDDCRVAKSKVGFTLEQSLLRQKELREQIKSLSARLEGEEFTAEQQREALRQLDDTISACALVAEQSSAIDVSLLITPKLKHKQKAESPIVEGEEPKQRRGYNRRWATDDATACKRQDIVKFFENNPGTNWTAPEIRKLLPAAKQAHAKEYLNVLLSALYKDGLIQRLGVGIYRTIA